MARPDKPARNAPCPCGSGLKYKKCHGSPEAAKHHPDGSQEIPLDDDMVALMQRQLQKFKEKFGREPGPDDPIFFDPDSNVPQPMDSAHVEASMLRAAEQAGIRPALIYAMQKTGRIVTEENMKHLTAIEIAEWEAAVMEYEQQRPEPVDMNKPLVEMDEAESQRAWDHIGRDIDKGLLETARSNDREPMQFVVVLLRRPTGERRLVLYSAEYGDNDAIDRAAESIGGMLRNKLLKEGETLERAIFRVRLDTVQLEPLPLTDAELEQEQRR